MSDAPPTLPAVTDRHRRTAWGLGVAAVLVYAALYTALPPIEGDSFDYASVGRNLVEHGEPIATHLRFPGWPEQALPAPGGRRAALMAWLMAPLYALFGASSLVIVLPFLLSLLLLPRLILLALAPIAGPVPALLSAGAFLLHPRLMHHYAFDPNVEPALICVVLASFWAFRDRRPVTVGVLVGVAALIKATAAILGPIYLALLWRHDRERLRDRRTWAGVGAALAIFAPMVGYLGYLRISQGFFGDLSMVDYLSPAVLEAHYGGWFQVRTEAPPVPTNDLGDWLAIGAIAVERFFVGIEYTFGTQSGVPEAMGLAQLALLPVGWRVISRAEDRHFTALWAGAIALIALVAVIPSTDARHVALFTPFTGAIAFAGLWRLFDPTVARRLAVALLMLEALPSAGLLGIVLAQDAPNGRARYAELQAITDKVPPGKTLVASPHTSMSFFTGRSTVPMPLGPVTDVLELARQRDAGAIVLRRVEPGPCMPVTPLLPHDIGGEHFCVYPLERPPEAIASGLPADLAAFTPLDRQMAGYPRPGPFRSASVLTVLAAPWWLGLPLVAALFALLVWLARRARPPLAWTGICVATLVSSMASLVAILG